MAEANETDLTTGDLATVLEELYEARVKAYYLGLILKVPEDVLDNIVSQHGEQEDRLLHVIKHFLKQVEPKPTWKAIADALKSRIVGLPQLGEKIEAKFCAPKQKTERVSIKASILANLEAALKHHQVVRSEDKEEEQLFEAMQRKFVGKSITQLHQIAVSQEEIKLMLHDLWQVKYLISESVYHWALQQLLEVSQEEKDVASDSNAHDLLSPTESCEPIFSKDTIYHASICCHALTRCNAGDYQKFFKNKETVPGHSFQAVSISRPTPDSNQHERYLIARQGESKYYIAFESQPQLSQWREKYQSFVEGVELESQKFPVRYIVELLNKRGCTVVLTGFSFGGMLACSITAAVWETPYIRADLLKKNLVCITFGQPLFSLPAVHNVAREQDIKLTIHTIHIQEDVFPRAMPVLNECCSDLQRKDEKGVIKMKLPPMAKLPFQDPKTRELLDLICDVLGTKNEDSLSVLKKVLTDIIPILMGKKPKVLYSEMCTAHWVVCDPQPAGLTMRQMSVEEDKLYSSCALREEDVKNLKIGFDEKHKMSTYIQKIFKAFLEKQPKYELPTSPSGALCELDDLKPILSSVELHRHGNELAVVVEGSNLWFSYQITLHDTQKIAIHGDESNGTAIKYNLNGDHESKVVVANEKVKVFLLTHFSSKMVKQNVSVHKKRFMINTRQRQLAELTPSKLIELAYLSALLEQYPFRSTEPISDKVEVIRTFLKKVVQVVPLESIAYAIAYGPDKVAVYCAKALIASTIELPASLLMEQGLYYALIHLQSGTVSAVALEHRACAKLNRMYPHLPAEDCTHFNFSRTSTQAVLQVTRSNYSVSVTEAIEIGSGIPASQLLEKEDFAKIEALKGNISSNMKNWNHNIISKASIEHLYSISTPSTDHQKQGSFQSPLDVLREGNAKLTALAKGLMAAANKSKSTKKNAQMLQAVNEIRDIDLAICTALLGGFMEQQEIDIPLMKSRSDQSHVFALRGPASMGVWALSSLKYEDIHPILSKCRGNQLLVKIESYIQEVLNREGMRESMDDQYAAKLQFMVQSLEKTVTCNSQYVSYSLERQLIAICKERKIDSETSLDELERKWGGLFRDNILSLVARSHRPLIARWMKWALMVHDLREKLAEYTAVGVVGLVNSGKSELVSTLFKIPIPVGTTEAKRTTVPFMYNLDQKVEGLDVVDFPGVDDRDETIPDLAELLLFLAQVVIFVVDYRRAHTESARNWLSKLKEKKDVPVLVCLTFTDQLYTEIARQICGKESQKFPLKAQVEPKLKAEKEEIVKKLEPPQLHTVRFFSFNQDWGSILNSPEGRERLGEVGIGTPADVGLWLVDVFKNEFDQEALAHRLECFMQKTDKP